MRRRAARYYMGSEAENRVLLPWKKVELEAVAGGNSQNLLVALDRWPRGICV
jgi:hypothetical protein